MNNSGEFIQDEEKKTLAFDVSYIKNEQLLKEEISLPREKNGEHSVHVYFSLTNRCMKYHHLIENVSIDTLNIKNNEKIVVNAFFCKQCGMYFINYEALYQNYFSKGMFPLFKYSLDTNDIGLRQVSELRLYGYTVQANVLSKQERKNILKWIIDSGLMSKAEVIKDLQFKIQFNGKKATNQKALMKWKDDLDFISTYIKGNARKINGKFVR